MAGSHRPDEPGQMKLLPAAPQDWLPAGQLAHCINDTVDALDLEAVCTRDGGGGSRRSKGSWRWAAKAGSTQIDAKRNPHTAAMAATLQTGQGRAAYRKRKRIAEPPNGWIKNVLGFRQFSLRTPHRVRAEWKLVCMALNPRRMAVLGAG